MNIARQIRSGREITPKTPPVKSKDYLAFIHLLPCVITGMSPVEAAHLSTANLDWLHHGRGKGQKASDRWALPLTNAKHTEQHSMGEMRFWKEHGINPYWLATVMYAEWRERGDEAWPHCVKLIKRAKGVQI